MRVELRYMTEKGSRPTRRHHRMCAGVPPRSLSTDADNWNWFPLSPKHGYKPENLRTEFLVDCYVGTGGVDHSERPHVVCLLLEGIWWNAVTPMNCMSLKVLHLWQAM